MWKDHFKHLLNSVTNTKYKRSVESSLCKISYDKCMIVSAQEVKHVIHKLNSGKAAGPDSLSAESLQFADNRLYTLLALCFSSVFIHGVVPSPLIDTLILPVVKNKSGDVTDKNNYRPIALANVISKGLELIMLQRCEQYISTTDNQFGFKQKHSTNMCIFILKEAMEYYKKHNTSLFVTFSVHR